MYSYLCSLWIVADYKVKKKEVSSVVSFEWKEEVKQWHFMTLSDNDTETDTEYQPISILQFSWKNYQDLNSLFFFFIEALDS